MEKVTPPANIALQRTWQASHEIQVGDIFKLTSSTKLRLLLAKPLSAKVTPVQAKEFRANLKVS
jgi:hypothetical protein